MLSIKFILKKHTIVLKEVGEGNHFLSKFSLLFWTVFEASHSKHGLWLGTPAENIKGGSLTQEG